MSGWSSQVLIANQVIIQGVGDFLLVYDGVPTTGNLVLSIAPAAGVDSFGNVFPKGFNSQKSDLLNDNFANVVDGRIFLGTNGASGPDLTDASTIFGQTGNLVFTSGTVTPNRLNACQVLLGAGSDTAGGGPFLLIQDHDAKANVQATLNGDLSIQPLETGRVPLFVFAQPGQTADLLQLSTNNTSFFKVDASGNLYAVGTINPLQTAHSINASLSTTTSTTFAASSTPFSASAVLPASGRAICDFIVRCDNSGTNNTLSDLLVVGSTSGTLHSPSDTTAIQWNQTTSAGPFTTRFLAIGVAGETVTATAQHRVVAGTGNFRFRDIIIRTLPI